MLGMLTVLVLLAFSGVSHAQVESAYTKLDGERSCAVFAGPAEGEPGDWGNMVCAGYKGYPIFVYYSDARESLFYGFPPAGDLAPGWESFTGFNSAGPTVEWRIRRDGVREIPFATIHRWFVMTQQDREIEVLVVEKVGQPGLWEGCAVGYVVATGNEGANEKARQIADEQASSFSCASDEPIAEAGTVAMPDVTRNSD